MNLKIGLARAFRPFAPCVLRGTRARALEPDGDSPYMLLVARVKADKCLQMTEAEEALWGIEKLNVPRSVIPAVTHVDYSARIQTVDRQRHGLYYTMMKRFWLLTGSPVIVNTEPTSAGSRSSAPRKTPTAASCSPTSTRLCSAIACS